MNLADIIGRPHEQTGMIKRKEGIYAGEMEVWCGGEERRKKVKKKPTVELENRIEVWEVVIIREKKRKMD